VARLFVISGPSGAGKGTLIRGVLEASPDLARVATSATTRTMRPGETDGREYFFLSADEFDRRVGSGEFEEHVEFAGNRYGTLKSEIDGLLAGVGVNIFGLTVDRWQRLLLRGEGVSLDDTLFSTVTATPALPAGRSRVARFCEGVELLALLESGPTVAEVIATLAMGRELGFAIVLSLRDAGLIAMDRAEEPTALLAPPL
jgi:hypothetical protein